MDKSKIKKVALIIFFIVIIFVVVYFIYLTFFKQSQRTDVTPTPVDKVDVKLPGVNEGDVDILDGDQVDKNLVPQVGEVSIDEKVDEIANGGLTKSDVLVDKKVDLVNFNGSKNEIIYYDKQKQGFFNISENGEIQRLSDNKFISVQKASWSANGDKAMLTYPDGNNILYDFEKDRQIATLPDNMKDFAFSSVGENISAKWTDDRQEFNYITTSEANGANIKFIEPMGDQADDVQNVWTPDNEIVATYRKYYGGDRQEVFFINPTGKNLKSLVVDGRGFQPEWNPKGDKVVYSVFSGKSDFTPVLWVANGQSSKLGYGKRYLDVNTWIEKCDFSKDKDEIMYCAVPDYLPEGSGWYPELAEGIPYSIYKINIYNGRKEVIAKPIIDRRRVSIDKIYVDKGDNKIYYTDESNGYLYDFKLKK